MPHPSSPEPGNPARDTTARILTARCPLCGALGGLGAAGQCDHTPSGMGTALLSDYTSVHWDRVAAAMAIGAVTSMEVRTRFTTEDDVERVDIITDVIREIKEGQGNHS